MSLLAGYTLGPVIGSGSTATVYRASRGEETVAIKVLHPRLASDPVVRGRFVREVTLARSLSHPAIVRVFDLVSSMDPEEPCALVMELCDGGSLVGWTAADAGAVLSLARDVAAALEAAHGLGIVHRDLKPSNILRSGEGFRVCDFGSAGVQDSVSLSRSSLFLDAPVHVAPEVFNGHPADPRSDLYSLGAILYEAATGRPSRVTAIPRVGERPDPRIRAPLDAVLPVWLSDLVMALLSPISERPPDATTVLRVLDRGRVDTPAATKPCLFCGAVLPAWAPACLGCGEEELGLTGPQDADASHVTLRSVSEDAATLERLTRLLREISGNPDLELELMFGDPRYYSREENKRKRRLPTRLIEGLSSGDALRLRKLLASMKVKATIDYTRKRKKPKQGPMVFLRPRVPAGAIGREALALGSRQLEVLAPGPGRDLATRLLFAIYGLEEAARVHELGDLVRAYPRALHALARKLVDDLAAMGAVGAGVSRSDLAAEVSRATLLAETDPEQRGAADAALAALEKHEAAVRRRTELTIRVLRLCGALEAVARELTRGGSTPDDDLRRALSTLEEELSSRGPPTDPGKG